MFNILQYIIRYILVTAKTLTKYFNWLTYKDNNFVLYKFTIFHSFLYCDTISDNRFHDPITKCALAAESTRLYNYDEIYDD